MDVAQQSNVSTGGATGGAVLMGGHRTLGEVLLKDSVIRGRAGGHEMVEAPTNATLVGSMAARITVWIASTAVRAAARSDERGDGRG
jgi:hypothetical protein